MALTAAEEIQASFQGLLAEDSPVRDLVLETLKPDAGMGQGDDGQALVDAIVGVHDTANCCEDHGRRNGQHDRGSDG